MAYRKLSLDLAQVTNGPQQIMPQGTTITEIICATFPQGAQIQLAVGDSELFTISAPFTMEPEGDDLQRRGLYWSNPQAIPGVKIELLVVLSG